MVLTGGYVRRWTTTYTDVFIAQDEYELSPFATYGAPAATRYRPETTYSPNAEFKYIGSSPGYAHNLNLTTRPESQPNSGAGGGGNARNPTLGGTRKHKRSRKQLSTTLKEDPGTKIAIEYIKWLPDRVNFGEGTTVQREGVSLAVDVCIIGKESILGICRTCADVPNAGRLKSVAARYYT